MARTLAVLSPFLGGWYYGGLLRGVARVATHVDGGVIAVQTLDAGTDQAGITAPSTMGGPVARDVADGFVVVTNAVPEEYVTELRRTGKPVVSVGRAFAGAGLVRPDNRTGVRAAIAHLIRHGHTRIAFAGYFGAADVRDRHAVYLEAMHAHGLETGPALRYDLPDNQESGGREAARRMLAAGVQSTAILLGTDANALGLVRALRAAGLRLPRDQAVIGFDDRQAASYTQPRLTSVEQPMESIGAAAAEMLLRRLAGEQVADRIDVPTRLVIRESCGCTPGSRVLDGPPLPDEVIAAVVVPSVPDRLRSLVSLLAQPGRPQELLEAAHQVHALRAGDPSALLLELMEAQGRAQFDEQTHLHRVLSTQYEVSLDLLRSHKQDPRALGWLGRTGVRAGALGVWRDTGKTVEIAGMFGLDASALLKSVIPVAEFPPAALRRIAAEHPDGTVFVAPVKVADRDWGLLAVVDAIDDRVATGREPLNQWSALLTVALDREELVARLHAREADLEHAAHYDNLTDLPNRALALDRLREAMERGDAHALLFLDLDGFKKVNDNYGHAAGDELLIKVGERLTGALRERDTAARLGGDEFLVLVNGLEHPAQARQVAERMKDVVSAPYALRDVPDRVTIGASIGVCVGGEEYRDAEKLMSHADMAMYDSKTRNKGSVTVFSIAMAQRHEERRRVEQELQRSFDARRFDLHYQPVVDLRERRTVAFEALLRWRHPERGLIDAAEWVEFAEGSGVLESIEVRAISEVTTQAGRWRDTGIALRLNVGPSRFWGGTLAEDVRACLRAHDVDPARFALEVTEGVLMQDPEAAVAVLGTLHAIGCEVHLDDFGTGHSSLELLPRLPIDALKIDRSFVSRMGRDAKADDMVRSIVQLGRNLGLGMIAEGVETEEQRGLLLGLGCHLGQGFLFSPAVPADEARTLMTFTPSRS
ncbi:EAL domain-containing protein [Catenuloplanes japonicus]|uniref:EAL domain-containing protein n=1 Tax=Catenuloplanes japonicus TaxID=33876 RepID=UPI00068FB336|nr:EAL domain-containing protein [Catenuloplanes japonicus]